jgi:IS30 family transposase
MPQPKRKLTQQDFDIIQANTAQEAAKLLGVHRATIAKWCKREGIKYKPIYKAASREEKETHAKIRKAYKQGLSFKSIVLQFDVPFSKVRHVLKLKYHGKVFEFLSPEVTQWVEAECPATMSVYEFIAILVTDAHQEEKE